MSKLVLVIVVLVVAYALWRGARARDRRDAAASARPETRRTPSAPQDMVRCETCALHLPREGALVGPDGRFYCSAEHRALAKP